MTSIVSYQKAVSPLTTIQIRLPDGDDSTGVYCTELATIDGTTYVAVPDGVVLPTQPPEITVTPVTLDAALREQIKIASPHCRLIAERMQERIRSAYSLEDELYIARIAAGAALGVYVLEPGEQDVLAAYQVHVESVRQWGRDERARLGL